MVYTYDGAGNRLRAVKTSGDKALCNIQYTYNDNNQITDIDSDCDDDKQTHIILTYDENGNLKNTTCNDTEKVKDYTFDNENRLKAVHENGTLLMAALYDGNGDRIFRLDYRKNSDYVSNQAGTTENVYYPSGSVKNAYDTDVILNEMLIPNGVTNNTAINYELTGYINDVNSEYTQVLTEFGANGNTTNVYEYGAQRNSATINGTKGYYLYDGRGSVSGLTGNSGGSMITYSYDAYGNTKKSSNSLNNPYQYNAEYTDSSTGLQYLRARYYESSQGRFTTKDTYLGEIAYPLSRNLYTYCYNNPLNYTDPSGHFAITATLITLGVSMLAGAAISAATNAIVQKVTTGTVDIKQVGISAVAGAVGGLVGAAVGMAAGAVLGAVGSTLNAVATNAIIGSVGSVANGIAYRGVYTAIDNRVNRKTDSVVKSMFDPVGMIFDAAFGGALGALHGAFSSGKIKNPFKSASGTKGEQTSFKAWIESIKKSCGEKGNAHAKTQTVQDPIKVPVDKFAEQAKQNLDDAIKVPSSPKLNKTEIIWPDKPHTNSTDGHWETIQSKAAELANSGEYSKIYVNKGLSNEIPGATPNRRPDIIAVRPDGTIDQFEIPSKTDSVAKLIERMLDNKKILGDRGGSIAVVPIE